MIHFGKWTYEPKTKTLTHSESDWKRSLRNFTHFSDVDEVITAVADRQQDLFDNDLPRLMNRLFRCNGCDPDHPIDMQALLERNSARLGAKTKPAPAKPLPKKKPKKKPKPAK
jgi:hypothetical protein